MAFIVRSSLHHLAFKFCISRNGKVICQIFFVDVCTFLCCSCYCCCCCCCCCSCCFKNRGITQHALITFHVWIKLGFRSVLARRVTRAAQQPPKDSKSLSYLMVVFDQESNDLPITSETHWVTLSKNRELNDY